MFDAIPFGKFAQVPLKKVPLQYLKWFANWYSEEHDDPDEELLESVQAEIQRRAGNRHTQEPPKPPDRQRVPVGVKPELAAQIVSEGRRALARKHHPDVGGNTEVMQSVNATADWLETNVRQLLPTGGRV
jgi:Putative quorum-sensing-regulated virulence factor